MARVSDEDATQVDLPALTSSYEIGSPTIEDYPAARPPVKRTAPGMPAPVRFDAEVTVKSSDSLESAITSSYPPAEIDPEGLAGRTMPDGVPVPPPWETGLESDGATTDPGVVPMTFDEESTDRNLAPRAKGSVPPPGAPLVQVSKSMELQVAALEDTRADLDPRLQAAMQKAARKRQRELPTEVLLPALEQRTEAKKKERGDGPLLALLAGVGVLILVLGAAVVWGLVRAM